MHNRITKKKVVQKASQILVDTHLRNKSLTQRPKSWEDLMMQCVKLIQQCNRDEQKRNIVALIKLFLIE